MPFSGNAYKVVIVLSKIWISQFNFSQNLNNFLSCSFFSPLSDRKEIVEVCAAAFGSGPKEEEPTRSLFILLVSWTFWTSYKLVLSLLSPLFFSIAVVARGWSPQRTRDLSVSGSVSKGGVAIAVVVVAVGDEAAPAPPSAQGNQGSGIAPPRKPHPSTI